jgi:outer membrane protein insertion porin family/translocation and assembly module TamA
MMAGRRSACARLVPMPLPPVIRVLVAGAAILSFASPGWAQTPGPAAPSTASGAADRPAPGRVRITRVAFTGVAPALLEELKTSLSTRASSRWPWGDKFYYSQALLAEDIRRIDTFYAERGYPDARVETYDVEMPTPDTVVITFHVVEGTPVRIASLETFGLEPLPAAIRTRLLGELGLTPGSIRTRAAADRARELARTTLQEEGYPYARVAILEAPAGNGPDVALTLAAEAGPTARFGPLTIAGQSSVHEDVIRRHLAFGPGDPFKLSRVVESQRRLYGLELFDFVNIDVPSLREQPAEVPIRLSVTEGKHHRVRVAAGYGTEEQARISGSLRNVNFLGGGRTAGIEAKWSSLDRGVRANLGIPYFFSASYRADVQLQQWNSNEPAYDLTTRGGRGSITREIVRRDPYGRRQAATRASVTFVDELERFSIQPEALQDPAFRDDLIALGLDPETGAGEGTLVALSFDLSHDTAGNALDARRGFFAALHLEQAAPFVSGDWTYFEATLDARGYVPVGRSVLAAKMRVGGLHPSSKGVPFFKRYFLGGSTTLRGWGRYEVSPLREGFVIGGLGFLELTGELRFPIRGRLSGVTFVEGGQVVEDAWSSELWNLRGDVGLGLRYATPIGPIRGDIGYQLNPIPGLLIAGEEQARRWRIHLSIGQAF